MRKTIERSVELIQKLKEKNRITREYEDKNREKVIYKTIYRVTSWRTVV